MKLRPANFFTLSLFFYHFFSFIFCGIVLWLWLARYRSPCVLSKCVHSFQLHFIVRLPCTSSFFACICWCENITKTYQKACFVHILSLSLSLPHILSVYLYRVGSWKKRCKHGKKWTLVRAWQHTISEIKIQQQQWERKKNHPKEQPFVMLPHASDERMKHAQHKKATIFMKQPTKKREINTLIYYLE